MIGETYITLQHHYGLSKPDARKGLREFLTEGIVSSLNGAVALEILKVNSGAGLMDRLIAQDYESQGLEVLTNDRGMGKIARVRLL